jgi:hypothetical protein
LDHKISPVQSGEYNIFCSVRTGYRQSTRCPITIAQGFNFSIPWFSHIWSNALKQ